LSIIIEGQVSGFIGVESAAVPAALII